MELYIDIDFLGNYFIDSDNNPSKVQKILHSFFNQYPEVVIYINQQFERDDFENIFDAIKYYQEENNLHIKNMSIAVASTTKHDAIKFTNNHWNFKQSSVFEYFKLDKLIFIND